MTPTQALLAALTATAQEAPTAAPLDPSALTLYLGVTSSWANSYSRQPVTAGADAVLLHPLVRVRLRADFHQQPGDDLQQALNSIAASTGEPATAIPPWFGNEASAELAWRSPAGLLVGGRVARYQNFSAAGMRFLTDELRITPDHDRAWVAGPTVGGMVTSDRYDFGAQMWIGLPVTTRLTPGITYPSPEETPEPRDLVTTQGEISGLVRVHQGAWFASAEAGVNVRKRSRFLLENNGLAPTTQAPILRISAGVRI